MTEQENLQMPIDIVSIVVETYPETTQKLTVHFVGRNEYTKTFDGLDH